VPLRLVFSAIKLHNEPPERFARKTWGDEGRLPLLTRAPVAPVAAPKKLATGRLMSRRTMKRGKAPRCVLRKSRSEAGTSIHGRQDAVHLAEASCTSKDRSAFPTTR
jgi:hypothetical protein